MPACDEPFSGTRASGWSKIDEALGAFEDAWLTGQRSRIEDHLVGSGPRERRAVVVEQEPCADPFACDWARLR
jgi:hypothetical protein